MSERDWAKMSADLDSHPKIIKAGRFGREVFLYALRRHRKRRGNGSIPIGDLDPEVCARVLDMPIAEAEIGIGKAITAKLLRVDGETYRLVGWSEEWKGPLTEAERKAIQRAETKAGVRTVSGHVPKMSGDVRTVPHREREGDLEQRSDNDPPPDLRRSARKISHGGQETTARGGSRKSKRDECQLLASLEPERRDVVLRVLERLSKRSGITYRGADEHVRLILDRLAEGITEFDLRCITGYCGSNQGGGQGWAHRPEMAYALRPTTLFGAETIERYLDAARSWAKREGVRMAADIRTAPTSAPQPQGAILELPPAVPATPDAPRASHEASDDPDLFSFAEAAS